MSSESPVGGKRRKDTARLVWDSKPRREPSPRDIEFQTAEIVFPNPERAGEIQFPVNQFGEVDTRQMNRLIWGDNLLAMQALLAQGYEGRIDLIYIDPPFNTDEEYNFQVHIDFGRAGKHDRFVSPIERMAYSDTWIYGVDSYMDMLYPRLQLARRLLSESGSMIVHIGPGMVHYVRIALDEVFGRDMFVNQIVWQRTTAHNDPQRFGMIWDALLYYSRSSSRLWTQQYAPYSKEYIESHYSNVDKKTGLQFMYDNLTKPYPGKGYCYELLGCPPPRNGWRMPPATADQWIAEGRIEVPPKGKVPRYKRFLRDMPGVPLQDLWTDVPPVNSQAKEDTGYDTQKPVELLERTIRTATNQGSLVLDFFCGSGTTLVAAERLGLSWIGCDLGKPAVQVARSRLVEMTARPFVIENIGNYQREMIYLQGGRIGEMQRLIQKLYGATPHPQFQDLGVRVNDDGQKVLVHVGYPDRPISARKAAELARQARTLDGKGYKKLVILGWDYEYNYDTALADRLKASRAEVADVESRTIPPEIYEYLKKAKQEEELIEKVRFFEKPYLKMASSVSGNAVTVAIERYVLTDIPLTKEEDIAEVLRATKDNFAILIDYWAIDWDYDGKTFRSTWQDIRCCGKSLRVVSKEARSTLPPGRHRVAVRVVDVFGNDAGATLDVTVK
jgi:adenine-specific DNA-methyltransferase